MASGPPETTARLFYDPGCGPCSIFARASEWVSHSQLRAIPYDGDEASLVLGDLSDETRFSYAHLVDGRGRRSGAAIMSPLVGLALGPAGEHLVEKVPPVDRGLRWVYDRFWSYRRTRGCAAPG